MSVQNSVGELNRSKKKEKKNPSYDSSLSDSIHSV
eukprot:CAMPEP_0170563596 /NCGR_PEP_ID=MMETSP0211-20121228/67628_1 /TAXON_ID=311385 /ORGANISM="Pseudokeronopsis sp., Strain OXSARD2" /LENGTH=34 /DNA_ID= /DNA_START= /DNA_END= /DNA_ORIENTATION=